MAWSFTEKESACFAWGRWRICHRTFGLPCGVILTIQLGEAPCESTWSLTTLRAEWAVGMGVGPWKRCTSASNVVAGPPT